MNDRLSDLISVCQTLVREGKKPSVGLVRSRAGGNVSIPEAIKGIQSWKAQPEQVIKRNEIPLPEHAPTDSLEARVDTLEKQVTHLKQQLEAILSGG
ncbi:hypothetical protein [Paraglaciecola sp. 20A4]|uniref:hypothetical protein n=1 Tax=Paraglaciecola sp. 20A4 TaxID=2687288 RepID=UPI0014081400|nr:hypothetical protein [Paraglaciecola sp. 20A4]